MPLFSTMVTVQGHDFICPKNRMMHVKERVEKMRIKKGAGKRVLCLLTAAVMLWTPGCGRQDGEEGTTGADGREEGGGRQMTMGRYVESESDLPVVLDGVSGFDKMADGELMICGREGEVLVSKDEGDSWERVERRWLTEKANDPACYIMDVKMDPTGTMGIIYVEYAGADNVNGGDSEESTDDNDGIGGVNNEKADSASQAALKCVMLLPDESVVPVQFPVSGDEEGIDRFWISDRGRYFVSTQAGSIYEVQEDGSSTLYLLTEGSPQTIQFLGDLMILDGYDFNVPLLYDMEQEEYVEDEALTSFVQTYYADRGFNGAGWQNMCLFPGEEDVIYLAGKSGLHRHVMGGSAIEQVIDGRLSRLGNPQYGIMGMAFLDTGEFLAVSDQGKLIRFTYDPDQAAIPQEKLKVYSLEKNVDLYAAVSFYQIQNPDVLVEYEIGMEEGEAVTKEDAVKRLNTKIMAGEGPDILMLDGLPADSYVEKGILCELDHLVDDLEQETFDHVLRTFARDDRVYMVPGQVKFPVVMGKEGEVSGMAGLTGFADRIEQMREEMPGEDLIGLCSEKAILKICAILSAQGWRKEDGAIDREAVAESLIQAKRIYESQMDGIAQSSIERFLERDEYYTQYVAEDWMYDLRHYGYYMDYVADCFQAFVGVSFSPANYMELVSIPKTEGFGDRTLVPLKGEDGSVFIPETILGINMATQKKELAEDFLKMFLGKENQSRLSGYAVNRAALDEAFMLNGKEIGENGAYGKVGVLYEDGRELFLELFPPTAEEIAVVKDWMEKAGMPYMEDTVFEECVFEEGSRFVLGEREIGETLDAVEKRLAIYLTE